MRLMYALALLGASERGVQSTSGSGSRLEQPAQAPVVVGQRWDDQERFVGLCGHAPSFPDMTKGRPYCDGPGTTTAPAAMAGAEMTKARRRLPTGPVLSG